MMRIDDDSKQLIEKSVQQGACIDIAPSALWIHLHVQ